MKQIVCDFFHKLFTTKILYSFNVYFYIYRVSSVFLVGFFLAQLIDIYVSTSAISLGQSYLFASCESSPYVMIIYRTNDSRYEMFLQFRKNKTNEWETIVGVNKSGTFITSISKDIETHLERNKTCDGNGYIMACRITANISIHSGTCKDHLFPSLRCQFSNGRGIIDSSTELELEIKGK